MKKFSSKTIKVKNSVKMTALSTRAIAANLILQVLDEGKSLSALIPEVQLSVKAQDLPLLQEICFGVCRVLPRLEQIIKRLVDKPLKGKTRIVHCLLLVGLYQLLYMRVPAHAAVDEVVNATKSLKSDSFRRKFFHYASTLPIVNHSARPFNKSCADIGFLPAGCNCNKFKTPSTVAI